MCECPLPDFSDSLSAKLRRRILLQELQCHPQEARNAPAIECDRMPGLRELGPVMLDYQR